MAKEYNYEMFGHPSILKPTERKLKIYFSEPEDGINNETGIILLIAGFGGNANSNVYKKMRNTFADKYNLVTVQCDYFGWEFMQGANNISLNIDRDSLDNFFSKSEVDYIYGQGLDFIRLMEVSSKHRINIQAKETLYESLDNYNEMGLIQAIDNISGLISIMEIIKDNGHTFNQDRVILYGHSHGAYLSYLCNALAPNMFSMLIDNSSWLFPVYIKSNRYVNSNYGNSILSVEFEYLARTLDYDEEILYLPSLYKKFDNKCKIICYHGTNDNLISNTDKAVLKKIVNNFTFIEIDEVDVDGETFKSTQHGLGADFLKLFDHTISNYKFNTRDAMKNKDIIYETSKYKYLIDYSGILPILFLQEK